ncbi:MAG: SpoIIE family protein phosphatase, partial [Phycisphaerales bacterium]|nr:SpoIIE family protein phosphatase [Phycisphaerales bacterium]
QVVEIVTDRARTSADLIDARLTTVMQSADAAAAAISVRGSAGENLLRTVFSNQVRANPFIASTLVVLDGGEGRGPVGLIQRRGAGGQRASMSTDVMRLLGDDIEWLRAGQASARGSWHGPLRVPAMGAGVLYIYIAPVGEGDQPARGVVAHAIRAEEIQSILIPALREPSRRPDRAGNGPDAGESVAVPPIRPDPSPEDWSIASAFGPSGFAVIDRANRVVSSRNESQIGTTLVGQPANRTFLRPFDVAEALRKLAGEPAGTVEVESAIGLLPPSMEAWGSWLVHAPIESTGWTFVTTVPQRLVMEPIVTAMRMRAFVLLGGIVLVVIVIAVFSLRISRPIEKLARAVERVSRGDLSATVPSDGRNDEMARLTTGFNGMVSRLDEQMAALKRETAARESIESELRIARKIQTDLLPRTFPPFPERDAFTLHAVNIAARTVAGDFFDFFYVGERLFVVIADVSGKGMPAALLMAVTRTIVRNFAAVGLEPAEIARRVNSALLADSADSLFVTMVIARYTEESGELVYVNAGHPPPLVLSEPGGSRLLGGPTAPLLGAMAEEQIGEIRQATTVLQRGETLLLYTDGLTEATSPARELFGEARLLAEAGAMAGTPVKGLCERLVSRVDSFQAGLAADDLTIMALHRV